MPKELIARMDLERVADQHIRSFVDCQNVLSVEVDTSPSIILAQTGISM